MIRLLEKFTGAITEYTKKENFENIHLKSYCFKLAAGRSSTEATAVVIVIVSMLGVRGMTVI
jgi:hypothetical protein